MAYISKITLPSGATYDIKDASAWSRIDALTGIQFTVAWNGSSTPVVANIPAGVTVTYNGTAYTGTLAATAADAGTFYLVSSATQTGAPDVFDEYVVVTNGSTKQWELIGNTQVKLSDLGTLAFKNSVALSKSTATALTGVKVTQQPVIAAPGTTKDEVLGSATTFTASKPAVTVTPTTKYLNLFSSGNTVVETTSASAVTGYSNPTKASALGVNATFTTSVLPTTTNIKATASDTALSTGTGTFVKSYPGVTSKLVTTTVTGVSGSTTASKATAATSQTTASGTTTASTNNADILKGASVSGETLIFGAAALATQTTTQFTFADVTVPKAASATTVATGSLDTTGTGGSVMTGLGTATTGSALTSASVSTQPKITLSTGATAGTGVISVATGINSASTTINNSNAVSAITGLGTATTANVLISAVVSSQRKYSLSVSETQDSSNNAIPYVESATAALSSAPTITVGTNDKVSAVTAVSAPTLTTNVAVGANGTADVLKSDTGITIS